MGVAESSFSCIPGAEEPAAVVRKERHPLAASVLPAPDSPEMMMDWSLRSPRTLQQHVQRSGVRARKQHNAQARVSGTHPLNAAAAIWNTWGVEISPAGRLRCWNMSCSVYMPV